MSDYVLAMSIAMLWSNKDGLLSSFDMVFLETSFFGNFLLGV